MDAEAVANFNRLADEWMRETSIFSFSYQRERHPNFPLLVAMGHQIIPLLLERMTGEYFCRWELLLHRVVSNPPSFKGVNGRMSKLKGVWSKWARENGYQPIPVEDFKK